MRYSISQLRDYSALFSRSEVARWFKNDFDSIDAKLKRYEQFESSKGKSYLEVLKKAYKIIHKNYPNEYIVKNEFLKKWIIKELGECNSLVFNEFRLGKATADLAMFNGVSKVFEVKSILDNENRLSRQIVEYQKVFNEVYLIVPECQIEKYSRYDTSVGIITYESSLSQFELCRKAAYSLVLDIDVVMNILHSSEYLTIVKEHFSEIPEMNSFTQFEICKNLISSIQKSKLNKILIDCLKKRQIHNAFSSKANSEFNQICLSLNLSNEKKDLLISTLKTNTV